jgi:HEAT repeat protein
MWKDSEGFHIVLLDAWQSMVKKVPAGVKVRRVSRALEILLQTQPDTDVKVQPLFNRLELRVSGRLDTTRRDDFYQPLIQAPCKTGANDSSFKETLPCDKGEQRGTVSVIPNKLFSLSEPERAAATPSSNVSTDSSVYERVWATRQTDTSATNSATPSLSFAEATQRNAVPGAPVQGNPSATANPIKVPPNVPTVAYDDESDLPRSNANVNGEDGGGGLSSIISPGGAVIFFGSGILLLLFFRHRRSIQIQGDEVLQDDEILEEEIILAQPAKRNRKLKVSAQAPGQRGNSRPAKLTPKNADSSLEMHALELTLDEPQPAQIISSPAISTAISANLFSADRIKQEVSLLVRDLPYSSDVISSRGPDDRRIIEASLVEAANAPDLNEDDRERARHALEEHGFVVRRGSVLLSASAAAERAAAARTLAEMHSPASMPFLLEALYDAEATVRIEAINSLGTLKTPSAIGALMDVALRHPETSVSVLSDVLKACSFEDFDSFDTPSELLSIPDDGSGKLPEEFKRTALVSEIGDLPESVDDQDFADALAQLDAVDTDVRAMAARVLGQFPVKRSVRSLTSVALNDVSAAVRAAAVASLGDINHESVFAHLLIAFSDESREVQAAAARSLSSLNIDRTEAYAQLLEILDEETLRDVARACSKTGMVSQAVDKLVSTDRRQAHEAFLLLSLLAKVNEMEAITTAVEGCKNSNARLAATGLFGLTDLLKLEPAGAVL